MPETTTSNEADPVRERNREASSHFAPHLFKIRTPGPDKHKFALLLGGLLIELGSFTDCSGPFAVRAYSLQAEQSLSEGPQSALQFAFAGVQRSSPISRLCHAHGDRRRRLCWYGFQAQRRRFVKAHRNLLMGDRYTVAIAFAMFSLNFLASPDCSM
jgi:hypothetical protein